MFLVIPALMFGWVCASIGVMLVATRKAGSRIALAVLVTILFVVEGAALQHHFAGKDALTLMTAQLKDRVSRLSIYQWEPLSAEESLAMKETLRNRGKPSTFYIDCIDGGCLQLQKSLVDTMKDLGWDVGTEEGLAGGWPAAGRQEGVIEVSNDPNMQYIAEAIGSATKGKIFVRFFKGNLLPTRLLIGRKPL